jgi:Trypsin-co-occurring domain 1
MSSFTDFRLPSGAIVHVQSSLQPPPSSGPAQASGAAAKAREAWSEGVALVRELAEGVVTQLKEATRHAEQVTVEFGVNISGKSGIILVEGEAEANLKVTVTWKGAG